MNVEMWFVKTDDRNALLACIAARLNAPPDAPGRQPDWGLESSYDSALAPDRKRKIAVSPLSGGWIAAVESQEALDFALLQEISRTLETDVIACQYYDSAGSYFCAHCLKGHLVEKKDLADAPDPLKSVREYLRTLSVPFDLLGFREAVQLCKAGWDIVRRA